MRQLYFFTPGAVVHNGATMSDHSVPTKPPSAPIYDAFAEQQRLTTDLMNHPDPNVRLIAHMSNRQLGMSEQLREVVEKQGAIMTALDDLKRQAVARSELEVLAARVTRIESYASPMI